VLQGGTYAGKHRATEIIWYCCTCVLYNKWMESC